MPEQAEVEEKKRELKQFFTDLWPKCRLLHGSENKGKLTFSRALAINMTE